MYDIGAGRWIVTGGLNGSATPTGFLAVSLTADPTGAWNLYQFPNCGTTATTGGDQPHSGFNSQWVVVNTSCSPINPSLAVFDKANLYSGGPLTLNTNWFEFIDPLGGPGDNPVLTYTPTINNREFLTHSNINSSGFATVTYSHLEGTTDAPMFFSSTETVTTSFPAFLTEGSYPGVSPPGCVGCMTTLVGGGIHSSGVFSFLNGTAYILSTMIEGDPNFSNATEIISVATNTADGSATAALLEGGENGSGPMASEIAMPLILPSIDEALIVYDQTRPDFFPGVKSFLWNMDNNTISYVSVLQEGTLRPPLHSTELMRWSDFIDAISPIPGSGQLEAGGTLGVPSGSSDFGAILWSQITP